MENIDNQSVELQRRTSAFNNRLFTFAIVNKTHCVDIPIFMERSFAIYRSELQRAIDNYNMVKSMTVFVAVFEKEVQVEARALLNKRYISRPLIRCYR